MVQFKSVQEWTAMVKGIPPVLRTVFADFEPLHVGVKSKGKGVSVDEMVRCIVGNKRWAIFALQRTAMRAWLRSVASNASYETPIASFV